MNNLRKYREKRGYTQASLSEATGINLRTVQGYEREDGANINAAPGRNLYRIARVLRCAIEDLLEVEHIDE